MVILEELNDDLKDLLVEIQRIANSMETPAQIEIGRDLSGKGPHLTSRPVAAHKNGSTRRA